MSERELCAAYDVDPDGPHAYEACDRIEQLLRYRSMDYLAHVRFNGQTARDFDFEGERLFAAQTEQWAQERGLEQLAELASDVNARLVSLGRFSLRVAREVAAEVTEQFRTGQDLRNWDTRLEEGDFDPVEVIDTINNAAEDSPDKAAGQAHVYLDALYPFVASVVSDAHERFNGQLAAALIARFNFPPDAQWTHYRGFSACIWQSPDATGSTEGEPFFCEVIGAPERAPRWSSPPVNTPEQALALLRGEVDAFWRQNPPEELDNHNAK